MKTRVVRGTGDGGKRWVAPMLTSVDAMAHVAASEGLHDFTASSPPEVTAPPASPLHDRPHSLHPGLAAARWPADGS